MNTPFSSNQWALILGGSSGFGLATARKLARHGMSLGLVHRDRRGAMRGIEEQFDELRGWGTSVLTLNENALTPEGREAILDALSERLGPEGRVRLLLHSIAAGNLKPLVAASAGESCLEEEDFAQTIHAMGSSLVGFTQALFSRGLFDADARVIGLTSEGSQVAWQGYAAVSAAKATLEAVARAIAAELGPHGIRCNVVQAGVALTPALERIPGHERMVASARGRNPLGRLTTPEDVADVIYLLTLDEARWVNGAVLRVDGGERIAAGP